MSNRIPDICRTILRILDECGAHALVEDILHEHIDARMGKRVTEDERKQALAQLKSSGFADTRDGDFGEQAWFITSSGQIARKR